jgi:hypothetical protein
VDAEGEDHVYEKGVVPPVIVGVTTISLFLHVDVFGGSETVKPGATKIFVLLTVLQEFASVIVTLYVNVKSELVVFETVG